MRGLKTFDDIIILVPLLLVIVLILVGHMICLFIG
jgi:hypothetical protein